MKSEAEIRAFVDNVRLALLAAETAPAFLKVPPELEESTTVLMGQLVVMLWILGEMPQYDSHVAALAKIINDCQPSRK